MFKFFRRTPRAVTQTPVQTLYPEGFMQLEFRIAMQDSRGLGTKTLPYEWYEDRIRLACEKRDPGAIAGALLCISTDLLEIGRRHDPAYGLQTVSASLFTDVMGSRPPGTSWDPMNAGGLGI